MLVGCLRLHLVCCLFHGPGRDRCGQNYNRLLSDCRRTLRKPGCQLMVHHRPGFRLMVRYRLGCRLMVRHRPGCWTLLELRLVSVVPETRRPELPRHWVSHNYQQLGQQQQEVEQLVEQLGQPHNHPPVMRRPLPPPPRQSHH